MPASKKKVEYIRNYNSISYQNIQFRLKKEQITKATEQAQQNGYTTISAYAKALLEEALEKKSGGGYNDN